MKRRNNFLALQAFQDIWNSGREVVVQQNGTGIKTLYADTIALTLDGFQDQALAIGELHGGGPRDLRNQASQPDLQSRLLQQGHQPGHIGQVKGVAGVVFRNQQKPADIGAPTFHGGAHGLHSKGQGIH